LNETLRKRSEEIRAWNGSLPGPVDLRFIRTGDERSALFRDFLEGLSRLAPSVRVSEEGPEEEILPSIRLEDSWTFHLVPDGTELDPFLEILDQSARGGAKIPPALSGQLSQIEIPSFVEVFVSTHCPNCPKVLADVCLFPFSNRLVRVRVFDGMLFSEKAAEHSIRAVPTVLLADGQRFTGQVRPEEIAEGLLHGDPARMGAEAFGRMINAGDAGGLAHMMLQKGQVFPGVMDLLAGELFSLRLGAMVAMEEVCEADPALASEALELLWERIGRAGPSAKGDMIYLIGEFGDESWRPRLEELLQEASSPELHEALEESLESLGREEHEESDP
jgi:hypothetical protein